MAGENVEVLRELLDAVGQRDLARLIELTDPEVEWRSFFAALLPQGEYRGHGGLREYVNDLAETWESLRPEVTGALEAGDVVVGVGRIRYCGKGSGVETVTEAGWMLKFRNTKVLIIRAFRNPDDALEAVGLRE